ncbi:hypothetical protein GJAV_G00187600 [Gymnothorax javanicus]|nr:hypothetical protein GJAV_G00187600 [Gymnothorax javanicus]
MELCQVEVEKGRFSALRREVEQEVQGLEAERARRAAVRLEQEDAAAQRVRLRRQQERRKQRIREKEEEDRCRRAAEEAQASHLRASVYFKETMNRIRQKEAEEEQRSREMMERRMQAVLSLKSSITATQEKLRARRVRGGDGDRVRLLKHDEDQRAKAPHTHSNRPARDPRKITELSAEPQKSKKVEMISRASQEETFHEKHKKPDSLLFSPSPPDLKKVSKEAASVGISAHSHSAELASAKPARLRPDWRTPSPVSDEGSGGSDDDSFSALPPGSRNHARNLGSEDEEDWEADESLALPEFTGLWDLKHRERKDLQDDEVSVYTAAYEGLSLAQVQTHRALLKNRVLQGKGFRGCPFVSKPETIHFKDFEVGKTYKKKVTLINVTYSTNYCKLLSVSEHLKDFITIHFDPPGPMSPGMACEMLATYKPMINKDLDGEVLFSSAHGPFSVPLKCTIKRCSLSVDCSLIDFGTHVMGETITRAVTLTNQGALGTQFVLVPSDSSKPEQPTSRPRSLGSAVTPQDSLSAGGAVVGLESSVLQESGGPQAEEKGPWVSTGRGCPSTEATQSPAGGSSASAPEPTDLEASSRPASSEQMGAETQDSGQDDTLDCSDIKAGEVTEGEIGPFTTVRLHIVFTPSVLGEVKMNFHITFSDPDCPPIPIVARGVGVSVPVWVAQPNIDLKICMYDRLYQDTIVVESRANTALRLTFEVCKELRNHMEVLPKTGFIQAKSTFNAQLKFLPRSTLADDAGSLFDRETAVLEVPMSIQVADQVRPVEFMVHAIITTSDLEFDRTDVDFGHCSVFESVKTSVLLTNRSLLPQDFGFLGVPEFVDVQPNDGFGTLLPLETLEMDIIFSPRQAAEYKFQLVCKSGINRDFKVSCRGIAVLPPLELSHSLVRFRATAAGDVSTAVLHVVNSHTGHTDLARPAPRIGRDALCPVGPKLFEFALPENSEISVTPTAGRVLPGQRCLVQVSFRPTVDEEAVREEAVRMLCQAQEQQEQERQKKEKELEDLNKRDEQTDAKRGSNQLSRHPSARPPLREKSSKSSPPPKNTSLFQPPAPADIQPDSDEFAAAKASLLLSFPRRFCRYVVPCFVSSSDATDPQQPNKPLFSLHNTLYLEVLCPAVRPALVILSNQGRKTLDFQQVAVGQKVVQKVTIQNISQESLELGSSLLDVGGPFTLLTPLRPLHPQASLAIVLSFCPAVPQKYQETLDIRSSRMALSLMLCGTGVQPAVTCSHQGKALDFGYVLEKESATQVFKLQNSSSLHVQFRVQLDSLSLARLQEQNQLPSYLTYGSQLQPTVGTQNYSGQSVFNVRPPEGTIPPGKWQEITVTFQPDHESLHYSDRLTVELTNKQTVCAFDLRGAARQHAMFLCGGDPLTVPVESLAVTQPSGDTQPAGEKPSLPVLLTLSSACGESGILPAVRELEVGCIRCSAPVAKKNVEFSWDDLPSLQQHGFTVEPARGTVEAGTKRSITVTWAPPSGFTPTEVKRVSALLTLRGNQTEVYSVTLLGSVARAPSLDLTTSHSPSGESVRLAQATVL